MGVPTALLPLAAENDRLARYKAIDAQLADYARQANLSDRAQRLVARYRKFPWLSPGVATAYTKWEEQFGTKAARGLAQVAFNAANDPNASQKSVNQSLEDYIATKDFQAQARAYQKSKQDSGGGGLFDTITDYIPVVGSVKALAQGDVGAAVTRALPGGQMIEDARNLGMEGAGQIPGVGPSIRGVSRAAFTAMESPWQEIQAGAMDAITGLIGPIGDQAKPLDPNSEASRLGAATRTPDWSPTSTGYFAVKDLIDKGKVNNGTGWFPAGEPQKQHEEAVRNIASFTYDGSTHFATPGRALAATITEPGTGPFNALSGAVDALAILKGDPVNAALAVGSGVYKAKQGFAAAEDINAAGGFRSWMRGFTDPPTVSQWLDNPKEGGLFTQHVAETFAGKPENLAELGRRTGWSFPAQTYLDIANTRPGDQAAVRTIMEGILGSTVDRQPNLYSFSAGIRNTTTQISALSELPGTKLELTLDGLSGRTGGLQQLHNHMLGLGLADSEISNHLTNILRAVGNGDRVGRFEAYAAYLDAEAAGLVAKGVPPEIAKRISRFALSDALGAPRAYMDGEIASGTWAPGTLIDGAAYPADKPYLIAEHLGDSVNLPPIQGVGGRNEALARYGRLLGIPGTGSYQSMLADAEKLGLPEWAGEEAAWSRAAHTIQHLAWQSNTLATHLMNTVWKPLALIRGAWTLRVIGEEQVRMAAAGYDSMFRDPLSMIAWAISKKEGTNPETLDWASENGLLRNAIEGAFGFGQNEVSTVDQLRGVFKGNEQLGRLIAKNTATYVPEDVGHAAAWADKLAIYSNDPVMSKLAEALTTEGREVSAVDDIAERFWDGNLRGFREELAQSPNFAEAGIDLTTREGADHYIEGLYDRLHYYTSGDPKLIETVATGAFTPSAESLGKRTSLKGLMVNLDGEEGEVVAHRAGGKQAQVMFADGNVRPVAVRQLELTDATKTVLNTSDTAKIDSEFAAHLAGQDDAIKPARVSGTVNAYDQNRSHILNKVTRGMFAMLMDIPTARLSRSQVFLQEYWNQMERLVPYLSDDARAVVLEEARTALLQDGEHNVVGRALKGQYDALVDAAKKPASEVAMTAEEADAIAKGHSLDTVRELLYDTHKRNRLLSSLQLLFPFGEAWKELLGSWARIVVDRPQTLRKAQMVVSSLRGHNPFADIPGAVPDAYADKGFFFKDPNNGGQETFVYPWSGAINDALIGVNVPFTGNAQSLSIGFNLIPGVGPAFQVPAMFFLDRYMGDKKWDPIRHLISPYGEPDLSQGVLEEIGAPAWFKKWLTAATATPSSNTQDARVLNGMIGDIMAYWASTGEFNPNSAADVESTYHRAEKAARWLYVMRGAMQFVSPAAPSTQFLANTKNGNLVQFSVLAEELRKLYKKDPNTAVAKFVHRFGEQAMYATAPKTLGSTFGNEYTPKAWDWQRDNKDIVSDYPLAWAEFVPRNDSNEFSNDAYQAALVRGDTEPIPAKERVRRTNNILGAMWYDQVRAKMGLKGGAAGTKSQQDYLAGVRNEIHKAYPGWREVLTDDTRTPRVVEELVHASSDPRVQASNPDLYNALEAYVKARNYVVGEVKRQGGSSGDFQHPNFAKPQKWAHYRTYLRSVADEIGQQVPQFAVLWQDTFAREMAEDN